MPPKTTFSHLVVFHQFLIHNDLDDVCIYHYIRLGLLVMFHKQGVIYAA